MRGRNALVIVACSTLVIFWPWLGNPFNYLHLKDSIRTSIPFSLLLGEPCATYKDGATIYDTSPSCYRFGPPKRFKGVWLYEFEGSTFLEGATSVPTSRPAYQDTAWLNYDPESINPGLDFNGYDTARDCYPIHAFEIEFIGQRSPEGHGHMGIFGSEIWVQKMLSAKSLSPPECNKY